VRRNVAKRRGHKQAKMVKKKDVGSAVVIDKSEEKKGGREPGVTVVRLRVIHLEASNERQVVKRR